MASITQRSPLGADISVGELTAALQADVGNMSLVGSVAVTTGAQTCAISGLDLNTDGFYLLVITAVNDDATNSIYSIYETADTTATNYTSQWNRGYGSTDSATNGNHARIGGGVAQNTTLAGYFFITRGDDQLLKFLGNTTWSSGATLMHVGCTIVTTGTVANLTGITLSSDQTVGCGVGTKMWVFKAGT